MSTPHWPHIAKQWSQVGPPLRPSPQDVALFTRAIVQRSGDGRALRALILGVTPELYRLPWPAGSDVLAADHTQEMIDVVWPGPREAAIRADWTSLPLPDGSRDVVVCDGGINLLTYPTSHEQLVRSLHRVLSPGGICALRLFVPPAQRETRDAVLNDLLAARVSSLNVLKLRLGMAMQPSAAEGVRLADVWDAIHRAEPDFQRLAARIGWPIDHLLAINTYRGCPKCYHFLTADQVTEMFCRAPGGFAMESIAAPTYELGERCPTVVFRRAR